MPTHFFLKIPQNAAAAIHICVMYRPDQPALSAQTDPADTFRLRGDRYVTLIPAVKGLKEMNRCIYILGYICLPFPSLFWSHRAHPMTEVDGAQTFFTLYAHSR